MRGEMLMLCDHVETVECQCGECQACPPESRGLMCADCKEEVMG